MAEEPQTETPSDFAALINAGMVAEADFVVSLGEPMLTVTREQLLPVMRFLQGDPACRFTQLMDITAVDYPNKPERFCVVYNLLSLVWNRRLRVKVWCDEATPVDSVVEIWPTAGWFEREAWDMYGVFFSGNPDLRRILTDYGFDGHPLRKDFPLTGHVEMRYDPEQERVVYEPVKLQQAFRKFDFLSPWDTPEYILPGDEKATKPAGGGNVGVQPPTPGQAEPPKKANA